MPPWQRFAIVIPPAILPENSEQEDHPLQRQAKAILTTSTLTELSNTLRKLPKEKRDRRVEKLWIGEDLPKSALVIIRHVSSHESPLPQFSFYRVDKRSLQCWRFEDHERRERLLAQVKEDAKNSSQETESSDDQFFWEGVVDVGTFDFFQDSCSALV
ncbi:MAG: hypothetical protein GY822_17870 [Deltaproteobacteria bacterium]|nr:hypothetical protein [Deltaproteobacteria bacterium]